MSESYFRPRGRRSRRRSGRVRGTSLWRYGFALSIPVFFAMVLIVLLEWKLRPAMSAAARALATRAATQALNTAIADVIANDDAAKHLVQIDDRSDDDVHMAHFDFASVSKVQAEANERAEAMLQSLSQQTFRLPVGQAFGGSLFAAVGPTLPVRVYLAGATHSTVDAQVVSVGVNGTVHRLYMEMKADVQVVAPFVTTPTTVDTKVLLAYVLVNGKVPNSYFHGTYPWTGPPAP